MSLFPSKPVALSTEKLVADSNSIVGRVTGFVDELNSSSELLAAKDVELEAEQARLQIEREAGIAAKVKVDNLATGFNKLLSGEI